MGRPAMRDCAQPQDQHPAGQQVDQQINKTGRERAGMGHKVAHDEGTGKSTQISQRIDQAD